MDPVASKAAPPKRGRERRQSRVRAQGAALARALAEFSHGSDARDTMSPGLRSGLLAGRRQSR